MRVFLSIVLELWDGHKMGIRSPSLALNVKLE